MLHMVKEKTNPHKKTNLIGQLLKIFSIAKI